MAEFLYDNTGMKVKEYISSYQLRRAINKLRKQVQS
jgi:hypothetical protein